MFLTTNDQSLLDLRSHDHWGVSAVPHIVPTSRRQCNVIFCVCKGVPPSPKIIMMDRCFWKNNRKSPSGLQQGLAEIPTAGDLGDRGDWVSTEYQGGSWRLVAEEIGLSIVVDIFVEWCFAISLLLTWPCIMWFRSWQMSLKDIPSCKN